MADSMVFKRGFLHAKGRQVKKWKKVWCKLQDGVFSYYNDSESAVDLLESFPLADGVKVAVLDKKESKESKKDFSFKLYHTSNKIWMSMMLAGDTEQEMQEWIKALNQGIDLGTTKEFGVDLTISVRREGKQIPTVVDKCLSYLMSAIQVPGIFRISGAQSDVQGFKAAFDRGDDVDFTNCLDPHVVANVLKLYLRELPNPLLTAEMYPRFIESLSGTQEQTTDKLRALISHLPAAHRATLQALIQFLAVVGAHSSVNMMTPMNLAVVFGPTILRPGSQESFADAGKMEMANAITEKIIQGSDQIFVSTAATPSLPPPPAAAPAQPLPEGWQEHFAPDGRPYYYNTTTQVTTWDRPTVSSTIEPPKAIPPPRQDFPVATPARAESTFARANSTGLGSRGKSLLLPSEAETVRVAPLKPAEEASPPTASPVPAVRKPPPRSASNTAAAPLSPNVGAMAMDTDELKQRLLKRTQATNPSVGIPTTPPRSPSLSSSAGSIQTAPPAFTAPSTSSPPTSLTAPPALSPPTTTAPAPSTTTGSTAPLSNNPPPLFTPPLSAAAPATTPATSDATPPLVTLEERPKSAGPPQKPTPVPPAKGANVPRGAPPPTHKRQISLPSSSDQPSSSSLSTIPTTTTAALSQSAPTLENPPPPFNLPPTLSGSPPSISSFPPIPPPLAPSDFAQYSPSINTPEARIEFLEKKVTALETALNSTNELLATVVAQLQRLTGA